MHVEPPYQALFKELGWTSFDALVCHFKTPAGQRDMVHVRRITVGSAGEELDLYFKHYCYPRPDWRFFGRPSKARREFENYGELAKLGVPVAERIAAGEERDGFGRLRSAWIITRSVVNAQTLTQFAADQPGERLRRQLILETARIARALHAANFFYYDFVWRNVLVSVFGHSAKLFLIDCPRGGFARLAKQRKRLRDLASLDKSAAQFCRRTERLRFLLNYLEKQRVDDEVRQLARASVNYRRMRWPEDWKGK